MQPVPQGSWGAGPLPCSRWCREIAPTSASAPQHHRPVPSRPLSEALFGYQVQGQRRQLTQNRDGTGISCNILPALPCLVSPCLTSCLFLSVMPNGVWCGCLCLLSTVTKYFIFHFPQYSYVFQLHRFFHIYTNILNCAEKTLFFALWAGKKKIIPKNSWHFHRIHGQAFLNESPQLVTIIVYDN